MKFITNNKSKSNLILCFKILCILGVFSQILSYKSNLKLSSDSLFLSRETNGDAKDPKSLFKPEAESCKAEIIIDTTFDDSYPKRKKNFFDKLGFNEGPITYLIDYLEEAFEKYSKNVQKEMKQIFDDAKQINPASDIKDPYNLAKIATMKPNQKEELRPDEYYRLIQARVPSFNQTVYEASITIPQIVEVFKTYKWSVNQENYLLEAKTLVDRYDFNGDGRLNFREFSLAMILKTQDLVRAKICSKCLEIIVEEIIDPIYTFIDCEKKDMISAEEMWKSLKYLIRKSENTYNIFTCKISNEVYRTSSINDFVLKAHKTTLGYLTRNEFRTGLLLAIWDRYAGDIGIKENEEKARKAARWANDGKSDNICGNIHNHIKSINKEILEQKEMERQKEMMQNGIKVVEKEE